MMEMNVEKLFDAQKKFVNDLDADGQSATKLCLLSLGALAGLAAKGPFARRLLGLGCTVLAAGLAIPLVSQAIQDAEPAQEEDVEVVVNPAAEAPVEKAAEEVTEAPAEEAAETPAEEVTEAPAEETPETPAEEA